MRLQVEKWRRSQAYLCSKPFGMRAILSLAFLLLFLSYLAAQLPTQAASGWLDVNQVQAQVLGNGTLFGDFSGGKFLVPASAEEDSLRWSVFRSVVPWIAGLDAGGYLHLAAGNWNAASSDFQPGIFGEQGLDQIWSVTKADILAHREDFQDNGVIDNPIPAIMNWPGTLFIKPEPGPDPEPRTVAPYRSISNSAVYDPTHGDFPIPTDYIGYQVSGIPDQMLFFAFHDSCAHVYSMGKTLQLQVFCTVFAYSCPEDPAFDNTVFVYYNFWSRGPERLDSLFFGFLVDPSIGYPNDDYLFSDHNAYPSVFGAYNGDSLDDGKFGNDPPVAAMVTLAGPLDTFGSELSAYSFMPIGYGANTPLAMAFPQVPAEFYNYLTGSFRDGSPLVPVGSGVDYDFMGDPALFAFPDTPGVAGGWSEQTAGRFSKPGG